MKYFLISMITLIASCSTMMKPAATNPLYGRIGHRPLDQRVHAFGMKRALGNVVYLQDLREDNPHEVEIAHYGLRCAQTRGFNLDPEQHSFIVTEYLTDREAINSLTYHLGKVIDSQDIGSKTTYQRSPNHYEESTTLIRAQVNHHNQVFRTNCRMHNGNVGGSVEYAVAIFDKNKVHRAKNNHLQEL
jgi:hypothetical protein